MLCARSAASSRSRLNCGLKRERGNERTSPSAVTPWRVSSAMKCSIVWLLWPTVRSSAGMCHAPTAWLPRTSGVAIASSARTTTSEAIPARPTDPVTDPTHNPPPAAPASFSHREILEVLSGILLGMLLAALDQTVVGTALPTIAADLHGAEHLSWIVAAYLLTSTATTPIYGKLSDLYGRRPLLQAAIVIFVVASA